MVPASWRKVAVSATTLKVACLLRLGPGGGSADVSGHRRANVCLFQERLLSRGCLPAESCLSAVFVYLKEPREGQGRDKCRLHTTRDGLGATRKGPRLRCCWFESAPFRPTSSGVPSSPAALLPTLHPSRVELLIPHHPFLLGVSWWQGPKRRWRRARRDWGIMTERLVLNWAPLTITAWPLQVASPRRASPGSPSIE